MCVLSGCHFFVCDDLPGKIEQQHDELFIVAKKAGSLGPYTRQQINN